ncbi:flagellar export protein FliJ [Paraliobacillus ryukyuensis]|uniref:flagellar export protein FliJ n=1 Tax=Paraliobacillus ryukyuensis TaxID=200904 RepID=UPI0009A767B1|nr:flagellar export protein FliJ [Paraliobacillus ryukyuensis]
MADVRAFKKILSHQERIKDKAQLVYQESVNEFETIATSLYDLLKKKEEVEHQYQYYLQSTGTVTTLATHYAYIEEIKKRIEKVQLEVNKARKDMEDKQSDLTTAHVEVKKIEKLIEKKNLAEKLSLVEKEKKQLDETSMRQFLMSENR